MDLKLYMDILGIESTSGMERRLAELLSGWLKTEKNRVEKFEVGDGTLNLLLSWGSPKVVFCTHCDTVPPYIPPTMEKIPAGTRLPDGRIAATDDILFRGRGTCDANGQIFSMFEACKRLEAEGYTDFGMLILAGEETGSFGAKAYTRDCPGGPVVIVGEPTGNCMVSASKGTKSFEVEIHGRSCHSGYPSEGESAVEKFVDFVMKMRSAEFPEDPELGPTTWNIGKLSSDNPQNILSPLVRFRIYFRTTFASDAAVSAFMEGMQSDDLTVKAFGGDTPMRYLTVPGLPRTTVAFGSDAPQLHKFERRALVGAGSILVAHTDKEYVLLSELETAAGRYVNIFYYLVDPYSVPNGEKTDFTKKN